MKTNFNKNFFFKILSIILAYKMTGEIQITQQ